MKTRCFIAGVFQFLVYLLSPDSIFAQASTACLNVPITYPKPISCCQSITTQGPAVYNNGGEPPQYYDANGNLVVTWGQLGNGYVILDSQTFYGEFTTSFNVVVVPEMDFTSSPTVLCNGQTGIFSIAENCGGSSFTWSAPSGWSINGGSNSLTTTSQIVNITAASSGSGNSQISVTSNYSNVVTTNVWLGAPGANISTLIYPSGQRGTNRVTLSPSSTYLFTCDQVSGALSYNWVLPGGFSFLSGNGSISEYITTAATSGSYTMFCSVSNSCGSNYTKNLSITLGTGGGGGKLGPPPALAAFPNPASSSLTVLVTDSTSINSQTTLDQPYQVFIMDHYGKRIFSSQCSDKSFNILTDEISPGIYYLNLLYKEHALQKQIIIKR